MKFDVVLPDPGEEDGNPHPEVAEEDTGHGPRRPAAATRMSQVFTYARTRSDVDLARVRSALNRMHHTIETAQAPDRTDGTGTAGAVVPELFRPEAFGPRASG
ncbi:hypothetical protein [Nocardiopsis sp. LOL_012]|uniref:hypothetical protein n=1 Tax=Nocardiopsis sp. LOL_012 TaxID=3345409 RepID=UPI003A895325